MSFFFEWTHENKAGKNHWRKAEQWAQTPWDKTYLAYLVTRRRPGWPGGVTEGKRMRGGTRVMVKSLITQTLAGHSEPFGSYSWVRWEAEGENDSLWLPSEISTLLLSTETERSHFDAGRTVRRLLHSSQPVSDDGGLDNGVAMRKKRSDQVLYIF